MRWRAKIFFYSQIAMLLCLSLLGWPLQADERFNDYEIRVIRPRFFAKKLRFELGSEVFVIMNQSFIYSYLASGILTFHFSEILGLELLGAYGASIDKEDKRILKDEFDISTQIVRTEYILGGSLLWTPIYGKYQLASGKLIYFDTFVAAGGGLSGVEHRFDHCDEPDATTRNVAARRSNQTVGYPTFSFGLGQRFFLNQAVSLKWDIRDYFIVNISSRNGACDPDNTDEQFRNHQNVVLQLGASRFF